MYIATCNAMKVPFSFKSNQVKTEETALVDSGATENFISPAKV
jgi:hypothetical protein